MRKIITATFTVSVSVTDEHSEDSIKSLQSCFRHYDVKGCLYDVVSFGALQQKPNEYHGVSVDVQALPPIMFRTEEVAA